MTEECKERLAAMTEAFGTFLNSQADRYQDHHSFRDFILDQVVVCEQWQQLLFEYQVHDAGGVPQDITGRLFRKLQVDMGLAVAEAIAKYGDANANVRYGTFEELAEKVDKEK